MNRVFKFFGRIIMLTFLSGACFLVIAYYHGGGKFRWFGEKIEDFASDAKVFMYKTADKADDLGQRMRAVMGTYKTYDEAIESAKAIKKAAQGKATDNGTETEPANSTPPKDEKDKKDELDDKHR
ncbi:MAG: hypothetical protein HQL01_12560 [Nitrospirae bacterium]|nr:hypothetical protein [Nitrospirota bacterium]